ncbi:MAG TPA: linear amide C-N hydrolase, partial [Chitinophagaceae bacterium]
MKKLLALLLLALYAPFGFACTTFLLSRDGKHYFGRNYDWVTGNGVVLVNARGLQKESLEAEKGVPLKWVAEFGSVTFNQYGRENPTGGMNEKGLVVELMWLQEARYPGTDSRPALDVLQWIQYQLDCSETVEDVIASDRLVRIASSGNAPLHYLVADAQGHAATIEFLDGRMVVHQGADLPYPVLTNTPYSEALKRTAPARQLSSHSFTDNSLGRFATACAMVSGFKDPATTDAPVDYAFSILGKVAQGDYTKWSIVYDISGRGIHFVTHDRRQRKSMALKDISFSCAVPLQAFPLEAAANGNIVPN